MEDLLTAAQVGKKLSIKTRTIYEWVRCGLIPHVKLGRLVRFRQDEVEKWLDGLKNGGKDGDQG